MEISHWVCLIIGVLIICFLGGAIGAYFETKRRSSQDKENNRDDDTL